MSVHPTLGVLKSKPRLVKSGGNGASSKEVLAKLSEDYLRARNEQMRSKSEIAAMDLSRRRGLLIDKKAAFDSLSYILVCFQRRALLMPRISAQRLVTVGLVDPAQEHAIAEAIAADMRGVLTELANMPGKVTNPESWLKELESEELGITSVERQQTPDEHKRQQARVVHRAGKKIASQQRRRGHG